jgi:VanZ family protein
LSRTVRLARAAGILSLILAALLVVIYMPEMSYHSRTMARLHNFAHMPLFTLVAILLAAIWPGGLFRDGRPRPLPMLRLWLVALLAGGLVELMQARTGRIPELFDVLSDGAGALAGLLLVMARVSGRWRMALASVALLAGLFAYPSAISAWDESWARYQFPLIADMEGRFQADRFGGAYSQRRRIVDPEDPANHLLEVRFFPALYPRFSLRDLPRDWSSFAGFSFTAINPGPDPFFLMVRVDDIHHDNRPADRYLLRLTLQPGRHRIQVPLDAVTTAPDSRPMDMTAISKVLFYGYNLKEDRAVHFDDFRLEP